MKKLLIISKEQFGYHTDIFKWCEYLRDEYDVKVITFGGKPKVKLDGIKNHYVPSKGPKSIRGLLFVLTCLWYILSYKGIIMVCYFKGCHIFKKCFPRKKMLLDIRTLSVAGNKKQRLKKDLILKATTDLYDFTTIISDGLRKKLSLDEKKSAILPLGADQVSTFEKKFDSIRMVYIGTLFNRNIHKTIKGLEIALKSNKSLNIHYDIIGDSHGNELNELKKLVKEYNLEEYITLHGYIQHSKLKSFFDNCNVGVSFVPITDYYEFQPVTKTFEYVLSGLYTIATGTYCNKEIITEKNGIIIEDTPEAFAESIINIYNKRNSINCKDISKTLMDYLWVNIVKNQMKDILNNYKTMHKL